MEFKSEKQSHRLFTLCILQGSLCCKSEEMYKEQENKHETDVAIRRYRLLLPITDKENSSFFLHVINCVNNDEVSEVARNDNLMNTFRKHKWQKRTWKSTLQIL